MTIAVLPNPVSNKPAASRSQSRLRSVDLTGPMGRLEAVLNEGWADAPCAALVCHPHPKGGGTLHNKVVYHAMKVLNAPAWGFGLPVLRFNFRGTGLSQGVHDGALEAEDVRAAMAWLENEYNRPLIVAGFSFGAAMALAACCRPTQTSNRVRALIALGLPTLTAGRRFTYPFLSECNIPKLFLSGAEDRFATPAELSQLVHAAPDPKQMLIIPRSDHFFTGQLEPMQQALAGWLKNQDIWNRPMQNQVRNEFASKEVK